MSATTATATATEQYYDALRFMLKYINKAKISEISESKSESDTDAQVEKSNDGGQIERPESPTFVELENSREYEVVDFSESQLVGHAMIWDTAAALLLRAEKQNYMFNKHGYMEQPFIGNLAPYINIFINIFTSRYDIVNDFTKTIEISKEYRFVALGELAVYDLLEIVTTYVVVIVHKLRMFNNDEDPVSIVDIQNDEETTKEIRVNNATLNRIWTNDGYSKTLSLTPGDKVGYIMWLHERCLYIKDELTNVLREFKKTFERIIQQDNQCVE